jgi:hypothetical protein
VSTAVRLRVRSRPYNATTVLRVLFWGAHPASGAGDRALAITNLFGESKKTISARRRNQHVRRVCSPICVIRGIRWFIESSFMANHG